MSWGESHSVLSSPLRELQRPGCSTSPPFRSRTTRKIHSEHKPPCLCKAVTGLPAAPETDASPSSSLQSQRARPMISPASEAADMALIAVPRTDSLRLILRFQARIQPSYRTAQGPDSV